MQEGEKCQINCDSRFASETQNLDKIDCKQEFEIELLEICESFLSYSEKHSLNNLDVINFLNEIKDRGNILYCLNEYNKAIFLYKK